MKRWISATLIFIMIFTLGPWTPVQARSEEVEPVEAEAVGTAPDDDIVASADAGEDADALPDVEVGELAESKDASDEIAFETSEDAIYAIVTVFPVRAIFPVHNKILCVSSIREIDLVGVDKPFS